MEDSPLFDLSQLNFDEFVSFFFDHNMDTEEFWYSDPELTSWHDFDDEDVAASDVVVGHMTRLFRDFATVVSRFSLPQINAGIWAMFTGGGPFRLHKHLCLPSVPLPQRLECIRSMYFVYSEYLAKSKVQVMENCFFMWWDQVASSFWEQLHFTDNIAEGDVSSLSAEQRALLDAMFGTLSRIFALPDQRTQGCALHGLGHLHHPDSRTVVQQWLDQHRAELSPEGIRWVEECRDGTVM